MRVFEAQYHAVSPALVPETPRVENSCDCHSCYHQMSLPLCLQHLNQNLLLVYLINGKTFIGRREQGRYSMPKVDWLWQDHFPLGDGRGLLGKLSN